MRACLAGHVVAADADACGCRPIMVVDSNWFWVAPASLDGATRMRLTLFERYIATTMLKATAMTLVVLGHSAGVSSV